MSPKTIEATEAHPGEVWHEQTAVDQAALDRNLWDFRLADVEELAKQLTNEPIEADSRVDYFLPHDFRLSVVVPVFNEEQTIATVIGRLIQLPFATEIIIVEDGSTDGTRDVLARLAHFCDLKIAYHKRNWGKGAALQTGIPMATGDVVVIQDADLEYDPNDLVEVIRPIVTGKADVAYGSRFLQPSIDSTSWSSLHRLGNRLLTMASNCLTGLQLTDMETCYKAFPRSVIQQVQIQQNRFGFEPEITAKLAKRGYRFQECPIGYHARSWDEGKKIGWQDAISALWCIFRYRFSD